MLSSADNDPNFVAQLAPLDMNTENFDAGDHGVEKKQEQVEEKNIGATGDAAGCEISQWIALNSGSRANGCKRVREKWGWSCHRWVSIRRFPVDSLGLVNER
jgi:hypothetical protein